MTSQKAVTPVKTGVQGTYNWRKELDSGFRRNDRKTCFVTFYGFIKLTPTIFHVFLDDAPPYRFSALYSNS
jgi:hypothetical protein